MSGFNSNYFNRHLINDMRNALNSVFIEEEKTSARNLEQWRERQDSQRADRIATGQARNAAKNAERETARAAAAAAAAAPAAGTPAVGTPAAPVPQGAAGKNPPATNKTRDLPRAGQINTNPSDWEQLGGRPRSINNADGSFNISPAARAQAQTNRDAISTGRAETGSGLSRMARGADGRPVSSYVNPNSPEGRVEASIAAGKEPDLQRDPNTGRLDPTRSARNLDRDATAAGNVAFDASVENDLGIENASGMNKSELNRQTSDVVAQRTLDIDHKLRGDDIRTHGQMPAGAVGSNTQATRIARETDRRRISDLVRGNNRSVNLNPVGRGRDFSGGNAQQVGQLSEPTLAQPRRLPSNFVDPSTENQNERNAQQRDSQFSKPTAPKPTGSTPTAQTTSARTGTSNFNTAKEPPFNQPSFNTANEAPPQEVADTAAKSAVEEKEKKRIETATSTRTTSDAAKQYVLDRRLQDKRNAEDERAERAARFGPTPRPPSNFVDPSADRDLPMWNGTIGPNGGQRATPAGSTKSTIKPVSLTKPKTPPQTFFPMR